MGDARLTSSDRTEKGPYIPRCHGVNCAVEWTLSHRDAVADMFRQFHSEGAFIDMIFYCNPDLDELLSEGSGSRRTRMSPSRSTAGPRRLWLRSSPKRLSTTMRRSASITRISRTG